MCFLCPCIKKDSCVQVLFMLSMEIFRCYVNYFAFQVEDTVKELEECRNSLRACLETNAKLTRYFIVMSFSWLLLSKAIFVSI